MNKQINVNFLDGMYMNPVVSSEVFLKELTCPTSKELLTNAVSLIPCAHKVQEAVADNMFGPRNGEWKATQKKNCPVCKVPVLGYSADHQMRNHIENLRNFADETLAASLEELRRKAKMQSPTSGSSYPGIAAKFQHIDGNWELYESHTHLCRKLEFTSTNADALISGFSLLGYTGGDISLTIAFPKENSNKIGVYLVPRGFNGEYVLYGPIRSQTPEQTKALFDILSNENEIPDAYRSLIQQVVEKGSHV